MTVFYIPVGTAYYKQLNPENICVDILIDDKNLGLSPRTLKCMGFLGLWDYLHGFDVTEISFDGVIFKAEENSGDEELINEFVGDFKNPNNAVLDSDKYFSMSENILLFDPATKNPTHGSGMVTPVIFEKLYSRLLSWGFCSERYDNRLSDENEYMHDLLGFLLGKIESGHTEYNPQWLIEFDTPVEDQPLVSNDESSAIPYSKEEMLNRFVDAVDEITQYWVNVDGTDKHKCEGVAFSIMNMIDGMCGGFPSAIDLTLSPHPDDKAFHTSQGEKYVEDGMVINDGVMLHEMLNR